MTTPIDGCKNLIATPRHCPLCAGEDVAHYHRGRKRTYWQCRQCELVFVAPAEWLDAAAEKARYDLHENDPADPGYRRFLTRLAGPLLARLPAGACGLDFGCGPEPVLAQMLTAAGMQMRVYDIFYAADETVWQQSYDFITVSEVVEHLRQPASEFSRLFATLKPAGWLGVMTQLVSDQTAFAGWHYIQDHTHICFYSAKTFHWIAARWPSTLELTPDDVALFQKKMP